jgi:methionine salvage enolase-phosphatase E1
MFSGYFDTTTGLKTEKESYTKISESIGIEASQLLFLTDIPAGMSLYFMPTMTFNRVVTVSQLDAPTHVDDFVLLASVLLCTINRGSSSHSSWSEGLPVAARGQRTCQ